MLWTACWPGYDAGPSGGGRGAANVDTDNDGLFDHIELELGTDPDNPDTDGDRLTDREEVDLGTDPLQRDSDRDGYEDADEVTEGSDPVDPESRIYTGGWPYYPFKDDIQGGDIAAATVGERFPRLVLDDQFEEPVDLYDFYREQGEDVLLFMCPTYGQGCDLFATYLSVPVGNPLRSAISAGDILLLTVLTGGTQAEVSHAEVLRWAQDHPAIPGPVLQDGLGELTAASGATEFPWLGLLDSQLTIVSLPSDGNWRVVADAAVARLNGDAP